MAPLPEAPATISRLRRSSIVFTPVVCHTAMVSTTGAMVPSQRNLRGVELHALPADRLRGGKVVAEHPDAVPSRGACANRIIGHLDAAGAGHVLRHDRGVAWNVLAEMAGDEPRLQVVFAADADADQHIDGLAAVEFGDRLGVRRRACHAREQARRRTRSTTDARIKAFLPGM